jgi:hypothetical protein
MHFRTLDHSRPRAGGVALGFYAAGLAILAVPTLNVFYRAFLASLADL